MAKIKSTLDIVMERTKNLTMTQKDRDALNKKELSDRIRGWVQMLVDHRYTIDELKTACADESAHAPEAMDILRRELLGHIDPDMDDDMILKAYGDILGLDTGPVLETIGSYRRSMAQGIAEHRQRLLETLAASGVSGSAVLPNVQAEPEWKAFSSRLKESFRQSLQQG